MPLPNGWVDTLFARLSLRYGVAFLRQYGDADPAAVKADWAAALDGLSGDAIKGGLERLPADKPPNALQFRRLCVDSIPGAERQVFRALPGPRPEQPAAVRDRIATLTGRIKA